MFERFTERARQVVVLAQDEARNLNHYFIGSEHLVVGLIREENGLAAKVLANAGMTVDQAREWIVKQYGTGPNTPEGQIPFTKNGKVVMELALREALSMGHNYIGTEHILLGIIRLGDRGAATDLFGYLNIDPTELRDEIVRQLAPIERHDPKTYYTAGQGRWIDEMGTPIGFGPTLHECKLCGCVYVNPTVHRKWHDEQSPLTDS